MSSCCGFVRLYNKITINRSNGVSAIVSATIIVASVDEVLLHDDILINQAIIAACIM